MKNIELIVFDIDSTLTESKQAITEEMANLVAELAKKRKVAIISGAAFKQFEWQVLSHLPQGEYLKNIFLLPADGTVMCDYLLGESGTGGWKCEEDEPLTEDEKEKIRRAFSEMLERNGFKEEKTYGELIEDRGAQMNYSALGQDAPPEIKAAWDPDNEKRKKMVEELKGVLPDFSLHIGGTTSIEITRPGVDKAYGLEKFLRVKGIAAENTLFVGDKLFPGGNDAPVIRLGVETHAVSGPEETKKVITDLLAGF